jgi:hypothetical protein
MLLSRRKNEGAGETGVSAFSFETTLSAYLLLRAAFWRGGSRRRLYVILTPRTGVHGGMWMNGGRLTSGPDLYAPPHYAACCRACAVCAGEHNAGEHLACCLRVGHETAAARGIGLMGVGNIADGDRRALLQAHCAAFTGRQSRRLSPETMDNRRANWRTAGKIGII